MSESGSTVTVVGLLSVLLLGLRCIPNQPVWFSMEFEDLLIKPAEYPDRKVQAVWAPVVIPVEYLEARVCRRIRQQGLDVGERTHDGFLRRRPMGAGEKRRRH
jgi:hypothetical protein